MTTTQDHIYAAADPAELAEFRERVKTWMHENMPRKDPVRPWRPTVDDDARSNRNRELQGRLFEGGFAAVCYPKAYGGQGLTIAHQRVVADVSIDFDMPVLFCSPTLAVVGPTLLEFGTEEQKQRYVPAFISGKELWVQFMSEPSSGSDLAGTLTRADRDGDSFVINGSKIWSTFAQRSDNAIMLARTNWDVPKHRGLTMFILPVDHPGIEIHTIKMVDGNDEFCQEYFNDLLLTEENVLGEVDDGWTVATRLMFHERSSVGGASPYMQTHMGPGQKARTDELVDIAKAHSNGDIGYRRQQIGRLETLNQVHHCLTDRVARGIKGGHLPPPAGSLLRLLRGETDMELTTETMELYGHESLVWDKGAVSGVSGVQFAQRQASGIGGGTMEIARNIVSERVLGMPREAAADRDLPFSQVPRNG